MLKTLFAPTAYVLANGAQGVREGIVSFASGDGIFVSHAWQSCNGLFSTARFDSSERLDLVQAVLGNQLHVPSVES